MLIYSLTNEEMEQDANQAKVCLLIALEKEGLLKEGVDAKTLSRQYFISIKKRSWLYNFFRWKGKKEEPRILIVSKCIGELEEEGTDKE